MKFYTPLEIVARSLQEFASFCLVLVLPRTGTRLVAAGFCLVEFSFIIFLTDPATLEG